MNNAFLGKLENWRAVDLLDTIIHEAVHYSLRSSDSPLQKDEDFNSYPYIEAERRTKQLAQEYLRLRRPGALPLCIQSTAVP